MPDPSPAKTKISVEKNSARAAFRASGWLASAGFPMAILEIGISGKFGFGLSSTALGNSVFVFYVFVYFVDSIYK